MSDTEGNKQDQTSDEEGSKGTASTQPPEPVLTAVNAKREDQIQNAVAFLSHPKVRSSTTDSKRTFLQKKGLTEGEIDDAFQRVPEASDTTVGPPAGTTSQLAEASRPQKPFPTASTPGPYQPYQAQTAQQQPQSALPPAGYRWSQILADAIKAQTAELRASVDSLKDMVKDFEKSQSEAASRRDTGVSLADLRQELRSFASTNQLAPSSTAVQPAVPDSLQQTLTDISRTLAQLNVARSPTMPSGVSNVTSPNTGRSGEGSTVSRQLPFDSRYHANPGQGAGNSHSAAPSSRNSPTSQRGGSPDPSPQPRNSPFAADRNSPFTTDLASPEGAASIQTSPGEPPHPASYMEVLEMLEKGQTPPGIRTDINDKPPNPEQAIPGGSMKPMPKPWDRVAQNGDVAFGTGNTSSAFNAAGSNAMNGHTAGHPGAHTPLDEQTSSSQQHNGVEITEVAATPSAGNSPTGSSSPAPWKPPAIPQASMNLGKRTKSEASSSA